MRLVALTFVAALASIAAGVVGALLLLPLWRWVEGATGIESIGHSGPAGWCYLATAAVAFAAIEAFVVARWRRVRDG